MGSNTIPLLSPPLDEWSFLLTLMSQPRNHSNWRPLFSLRCLIQVSVSVIKLVRIHYFGIIFKIRDSSLLERPTTCATTRSCHCVGLRYKSFFRIFETQVLEGSGTGERSRPTRMRHKIDYFGIGIHDVKDSRY